MITDDSTASPIGRDYHDEIVKAPLRMRATPDRVGADVRVELLKQPQPIVEELGSIGTKDGDNTVGSYYPLVDGVLRL